MKKMTVWTRGGAALGMAVAISLIASTQAGAAGLDSERSIAADAAADFTEAAPALDGVGLPLTAVDGEFTTPSAGAGDGLVAPADGSGQLVLGAGLAITLPIESTGAEGVLLEDGTLVYPADESGASSVVEPLVGGVRIATVLQDEDAPSSYTYEFSGARPELLADGSIALHAAPTGEQALPQEPGVMLPAGIVEAPWATDAAGQAVPTHFEITGTSVVQVIEPLPSTVYPVVADPTAWWGVYWHMSNSAANKLSAALYGGAGITGIATILLSLGVVSSPGAVATGLAAAILTIGGAAISFCNAAGRGIVVAKPWVGNPYCWSR